MKKIFYTKKFTVTSLIIVIGAVFMINSLTPAITSAQYDYGYTGGTDYSYTGGTDYSYGYTGGVDYDYTGGYTAPTYATVPTYSGTADAGYYDYTVGYTAPIYSNPISVYATYPAYSYQNYTYPSYAYGYTYTRPITVVTTPAYYTYPYPSPYTTPYQSPYVTPYSYPTPAYNTPYASPYSYPTPAYSSPYASPYSSPYATPYPTPYSYPTPAYNTPYSSPYSTPYQSPYASPYATPYPTPNTYSYPYPTPATQQVPYVTISSNPSIINLGSSSLLTWSSSNANNCYASGGWSGTKSLSGSETVYPQISTTYTVTCYNNSGQATAQTVVSVNNQQLLASAVNITTNPRTITNGSTSILVWSSTNASTCYASGAWSGTKALSGSESVSPTINSTYTITCSNNVGSASNSDTVFVNTVLNQPPVTGFSAACVASPSIATVNRNVTFVAGKYGGTAPYYYTWSGDITGSGDVKNFIFDTIGFKSVTLRITDGNNQVAVGSCSVQINPANVTVTTYATPYATPATGVVLSDYSTICESLGYVKTAVATCKTYTACSDGKTYEGAGTNGSLIKNDSPTYPAPVGTNTDNSGDARVTSNTTPTKTAGGDNTNALQASVLFNEQGNISRLAFLLIWYLAILLFIGFLGLIYAAVKRREA